MKHAQLYLAALVALIIIGCGGSGSSGSSTTSTDGSTTGLSTPRIEAIVRVERTNLAHPEQWSDDQLLDPTNNALKADLLDSTVFGFQDPSNFQVNERYFFQLASYRADGTRVILPASFQSLDVNSTYGNLASNSGAFDVGSLTTTNDNAPTGHQTVLAYYNGATFSTTYDVKERQLRFIGVVKRLNGLPVDGAVLQFYYNASYTGQVKTAHDGTFRGSVQANSNSFTIDPHSLAADLYPVFTYGTATYNAGSPDCRATIILDPNNAYVLQQSLFVTPTGGTGPVVNGCSGASIRKH